MAIADLDNGIDVVAASYDIGIIGAGAAGITLGVELARRGLQVLVCEGGSRERTDKSQDIYRGETSPNYYKLDNARLRFLGGSTNHWGGYVQFLDPSDFAPRPPGTPPGWPIAHSDIAPYFPGAREWVGLPRVETPVADVAAAQRFPTQISDSGGIRSELFRFSYTGSFGTTYRELLRETPGLTVAINANVVELRTTATGIRALVLRNWKGASRDVAVARTVFACGGVENPRLMLNFAERHDLFSQVVPLIGTHFMEHLCVYHGAVLSTSASTLEALAPITDQVGTGPDAYQWVGSVDPEIRAANGIDTNVSFTLDSPLVMRTAELTDTDEGLGVKQLLDFTGTTADTGLFITPRAEQRPNRDSRVTLTDRRDALGFKRVRLDWRYAPEDFTSIVRTLGMFARAVAAADMGRVFVGEPHSDWSDRFGRPVGGFHHMGTTRMSESAATGVVDANLRVHGTDNVYVAGSSVFPTAGWANPTINLIAFSLRLADHLVAS